MNMFEETARSLAATVQLLRHDREGLNGFNNTASGFWHSFAAIILIAPLYLFIASIDWKTGANSATGSRLVSLGALALQWVIWPVIMVFVTRWLGLGQHFARYVIVYNWSNVVIVALLAIPITLFKIGLLPFETTLLLTGILQLASFYFEWYLARLSLDTSGLIAGAVVLGNFVLSVGILRIAG